MTKVIVPTDMSHDLPMGLEPLPEDHDLAKKIKTELADATVKAQFKIEIQFGKDRSTSELKPSVGVMLIWESGKRLHGGGDEQMFWCGYQDCQSPISSASFSNFHVVCPSCNRESFLDQQSKRDHVSMMKQSGVDSRQLESLPLVFSERLFRLPPSKLADLIEKVWFSLGCNADIYLKYHPTDIRYKAMATTFQNSKQRDKARALRGLHIYPLARILKDTSAGGSAVTKFKAFITA